MLLALIAVYYGAAQLVFALEVAGPVAAVVWLPVGIGVAFLYLGGLSLWPGLVIADLLVTNYDATPVGTALLQTCGNLLEVVVAVLLLRRLVPDGAPLRSIRALMGMLAALAAGAAASATVGSLAQLAGGVIGSGAVPHGLAHVVARRLCRRDGPGPARADVVPAAATGTVVGAGCGGRAAADRGGRAWPSS